jgi:hypothetical protein
MLSVRETYLLSPEQNSGNSVAGARSMTAQVQPKRGPTSPSDRQALWVAGLSRSGDTELLEDLSLPDATVARAYRELQVTHRWLSNTAALLRVLLAAEVHVRMRQDPIPIRSVLDIGCGPVDDAVELKQFTKVCGLAPEPAEESSKDLYVTPYGTH